MIEAAGDSGAAQVVVPDVGSVIDALRRGNEGAFARLVDQYHPSLLRVARLYIANRAIADEVVQDTWLGVIQGIWAFEGRSSLKTWIFRILINRAKTRAAREGRMVPFPRFDGDKAKAMKREINTKWIYPPPPNRADAYKAAEWARLVDY